MRILVTGKDGQLGWELSRTLQPFGQVIPVGRDQMDLERPDTIRATIREIRPGLIVNAAAYTAVDQAEAEPERARAINGIGPGIIAEEAKRIAAGLIHYSTDYVFDGTKENPYVETDRPNPRNVYGHSKWQGEQSVAAAGGAHLILRTCWIYGARGKNFLRTLLRLASERNELRIVADQFGTPTWSHRIASTTARLLAAGPLPQEGGLYHLAASGHTSWFGFSDAIFRGLPETVKQQMHADVQLVPITSDAYPTAARRPVNSQLSCAKLRDEYDIALPAWQDDLQSCLQAFKVAM